jgi:ABC-type transporter Mla subunit MlaD
MPENAYVWIAIVVVVGIVVALAIWKGRGLRLKRDQGAFSVEVDAESGKPRGSPDSRRIRVGNQVEINDAEVGNIKGVQSDSVGTPDREDVEVATGARIRGSRVGDIVGAEHKGGTGGEGT